MATRLFVCPGLLQFFSRGEIKWGVARSPLRAAGSCPIAPGKGGNKAARGSAGISRGILAGAA